MVLIGIGANLASPGHDTPLEACEAVLSHLNSAAVRLLARSRWYRSAPVPTSDQPWFINGVASVETSLLPAALMAHLHGVEADFGRVRGACDEARTMDLDILDMDGVCSPAGEVPILPHPRLHERAFVLLPLNEIAPLWRHPRTNRGIGAIIDGLDGSQIAEPIENRHIPD